MGVVLLLDSDEGDATIDALLVDPRPSRNMGKSFGRVLGFFGPAGFSRALQSIPSNTNESRPNSGSTGVVSLEVEAVDSVTEGSVSPSDSNSPDAKIVGSST